MRKHENLNLFFTAKIILRKISYGRNSQSNDDVTPLTPFNLYHAYEMRTRCVLFNAFNRSIRSAFLALQDNQ